MPYPMIHPLPSITSLILEGSGTSPKWNRLGIPNIISNITHASPPCAGATDDDFVWGASPDGLFSTKSAYEALHRPFATYSGKFAPIWK